MNDREHVVHWPTICFAAKKAALGKNWKNYQQIQNSLAQPNCFGEKFNKFGLVPCILVVIDFRDTF